MSEFLSWLFSQNQLFWLLAAVISFWAALNFLVCKLRKFALLFAVLFCASFGILAAGPLGDHFRERMSGKREPAFKMLDKQQIDAVREKIRREREESP